MNTTTVHGKTFEGVNAFYHGGPADGLRFLWPLAPEELEVSKVYPTFTDAGQPLAIHRYAGVRPTGCDRVELHHIERLPPEHVPSFATDGHLLYEGNQ